MTQAEITKQYADQAVDIYAGQTAQSTETWINFLDTYVAELAGRGVITINKES